MTVSKIFFKNPLRKTNPDSSRWLSGRDFLLPVVALLLFLLNMPVAFAVPNADFDRANAYYKSGDYQHAIRLYLKIIDGDAESPEIYFNLGNCYFKSDSIAKAILYYEKAKKLSPSDEDVLFNLKIANQRITDKINPAPALFIYSWWQAFKASKNADSWAWLSVACLCLSFMLFAAFLAFNTSALKKTGFWGGLFFTLLAAFMFFLANTRYHSASGRSEAVVMSDAINVKSSPSKEGKDIFILHAGSKVNVINTEGDWYEVRIPDNNVGWLPGSCIQFI